MAGKLQFTLKEYQEAATIYRYNANDECYSLSRSAWLAKNHRVGAVFTFGIEPPKERNIIVFDDFVTSGATMISKRELLMPLGKNLVFFIGINNKV